MGGTSSKVPEFDEAIAQFTNREQEEIAKLFKRLCGEGKATFDRPQLQEQVGRYLLSNLSDKLYGYMQMVLPPLGGAGAGTRSGHTSPTTPSHAAGVYYHSFVIALCHILKGGLSEKTRLVCYLASGGPTASTKQLMQFIEDMTEAYKMTMQTGDEYATWKLTTSEETLHKFSGAMLQDLTKKDGEKREGSQESWFTDSGLENWISNSSLLTYMMDQVFVRCFPLDSTDELSISPFSGSTFPNCEGANWSQFSTILDIPSILYLNHHLPLDLRGTWRFLFGNTIHGESFMSACKHIIDRGPSLLIIKDTKGHVFGGFAAESWAVKPQFGGSSKCFLFSLSPTMAVYNASGYNANFMYLNHGQETLPNGLGMGGQFDYCGIWLEADYGKGHSRAKPHCTTYHSPQLSSEPDFEILTFEVWGVGPEPKKPGEEEEDEADAPKSLLDKDPTAKAMLELLNRGPVSEGLRENDPTSDIPEEHETPHG